MISPYIQLKLDENSIAFKALNHFAEKRGYTTTPAAILAILNSLVDIKELSAPSNENPQSVKSDNNKND